MTLQFMDGHYGKAKVLKAMGRAYQLVAEEAMVAYDVVTIISLFRLLLVYLGMLIFIFFRYI